MVAMAFCASFPLQQPPSCSPSLFSRTLWLLKMTDKAQVYIAYMGAKPTHKYEAEDVHLNLLEQVLEGSLAKESLLYSYGRSFNGFAAKLTAEEQQNVIRRAWELNFWRHC